MANGLFSFPNPVNEVAARSVAAGVALLSVLTIGLGVLDHRWLWLSLPIAMGFLARVLTGPTLSPLGQLATRVIAPAIGHPRFVPGPPKRFAQGIGATLSVAAVICQALGRPTATIVLLALIVVAATLESVFAICLGCHAFAQLIRAGLIPQTVCAECADVRTR